MAMRFMMTFKSDEEPRPGVSACKQQLPEMARLMDSGKARFPPSLGALKAPREPRPPRAVVLVAEGLLPGGAGSHF
jgi:hypothetical protein